MGGLLSQISLLHSKADQREIMKKNAKGKSRIYGNEDFSLGLQLQEYQHINKTQIQRIQGMEERTVH